MKLEVVPHAVILSLFQQIFAERQPRISGLCANINTWRAEMHYGLMEEMSNEANDPTE